MLHTTFKKAKAARACASGYDIVAASLGGTEVYGDDKPIPLTHVVKEIGLGATLPILPEGVVEQDKVNRFLMTFACDCVERRLPLSKDDRPTKAIAGVRAYVKNQGKRDEALSLCRESWEAGKDVKLGIEGRFVARAASETIYPARICETVSFVLRSLPRTERDNEVEWQTKRFLKLLGD
jgi:hypothetical protein